MALRIEVYIQGEESKGAIDLAASMEKLRAQLEQVDDAKHTTVTLRLSSVFGARQMNSGGDWDPSGELSRVWREGDWVVYAPTVEEEAQLAYERAATKRFLAAGPDRDEGEEKRS